VNAGFTTWHGFATAIVEEYSRLQSVKGWQSLKVQAEGIQAITTEEYPTPAVRPANSCLDCHQLARDYSITVPNWRDALIDELKALPSS
jgi:dTDP-4-dehydrorhamnose reductase